MKSKIKDKLNSSDYVIATSGLKELLSKNKLAKNDIENMLKVKNRLIIGDFLDQYKYFQEKDLKLIENFIIKNLDHDDRIFVSDLIEFSTSWVLTLPYKKCLDFLIKYGDDDDYVLLASIDYVFENLKMAYIDEIFSLLYLILNNPESNQSAQIKAALALYRITGKNEFIDDLKDLVVNGDKNNKILLANILSLKHNSPLYFESYHILKTIL